MTAPNPLRAYAAVTAAYWAFMLSDGALRMLVLLHFNALGFSPVQLAWLFLLYELAGIVTNLAAGPLAARFGLAATLYAGLALQIGALVVLAIVFLLGGEPFTEQIIITAQGEYDLRAYTSDVDNGDRWGIIGLQVLRPGPTTLLAFVGVRR